MRWRRWVVGALFPPRCLACRGYVSLEGALGEGVARWFCAGCQGAVYPVRWACPCCGALEEELLDQPPRGEVCGRCREVPVGWGEARAGFEHAGAVREAVLRAKKVDGEPVAAGLGVLLAGAVEASWGAGAALVPVPLSAARLEERGFNQAEVIAGRVGARWGAPVLAAVLRRTQQVHRSQRELGRAERLESQRGSYEALAWSPSAGAREVIVVDDVMTTGATMTAAAEALEASGWTVRGVLAVSRTR